MENIIGEIEAKVQFNRDAFLDLDGNGLDWNKNETLFARVIYPKGFEKKSFEVQFNTAPKIVVPHRFEGQFLHQALVKVRLFQLLTKVVEEIEIKPEVSEVILEEPEPLNPPVKEEKPKSVIKSILQSPKKVGSWQNLALERTQARRSLMADRRQEIVESKALKPSGYDGAKILTGDDTGYTHFMGVLELMRMMELGYNKKDYNKREDEIKPLCNYFDLLSFSGIGVIAGLFVALGTKAKENGSLEYLQYWWETHLSKVYYLSGFEELQIKGKQLASELNPLHMLGIKHKPKENPGIPLKHAEKVLRELFTNKHNGEDLRMKDLACEVYQPIFFNDERTRVYSRRETPHARLVDVAMNTGLDPLYFQTRPVENMGVSLGPVRRSFDLPLAQYNDNTTMISLGRELRYQEAEKEDNEGLSQAEIAFLNKSNQHLWEYQDAKKYVMDHPHKVKFVRVEARHCYMFIENSIDTDDLKAAKESAWEHNTWSNVTMEQPLLELDRGADA